MINVGVRKRYDIGISGLLRALCVIIAVIILLPFLSFLGAINLTPLYSSGTFEEFYDQVSELYAKFGDVQEERVVISKDDAVEIDGEVFVEASSLSEDMINGVVELDSASIAENGACADEISAQGENASNNNTSENGEAPSAVSVTSEVLSGDVARSGDVCETSDVGVESASAIEVSKKAESAENRAFVNLNDTKYIVTETAKNYILSNLYIVRNHRIFSDGHQSEGIDFRFQHVRRFLAYAHDNIGTYFDILCNNRLVDRSSFSDLTVTHDNRIPDHSALFNLYVCPYNRIMYFSVNFSAFTDNAALYRSFGCNVLRADDIALGVDLPEFLIQVEFRNNIDQLHIGFPVRAQGSYIFPVSVEFISKQTLTVVLAVRKNMFSKVTALLILQRL